MPQADVDRLQRVAFARGSSENERMHALAALAQIADDAEAARFAAETAAADQAERSARRAVERHRRVRIIRAAALGAAALVVATLGVTAYAASSGSAQGGSSSLASTTAPSGEGPQSSTAAGTAPGAGNPADSSGVGAAGDSVGLVPSGAGAGSAAGTGTAAGAGTGTGAGVGESPEPGPVSTDGSSTTYSNATHSVTSDSAGAAAPGSTAPGSTSQRFGSDGSAAQSPAVIFTVAQTPADHPAEAIPGNTVASTYRLLSRGQYTPGSAYAALSSDGRICLVVFGGEADFGETCQSVLLTLTNGLQAGVTSSTNLNPRSGSQLVTVVHFAATWNVDGTFSLSVSDPHLTVP